MHIDDFINSILGYDIDASLNLIAEACVVHNLLIKYNEDNVIISIDDINTIMGEYADMLNFQQIVSFLMETKTYADRLPNRNHLFEAGLNLMHDKPHLLEWYNRLKG